MRPEYYADLYRQYTTFVKASGGVKTKFIASGGQGELTEWTEVLSKNIPRKNRRDCSSLLHFAYR